jgi:hypothetical protein
VFQVISVGSTTSLLYLNPFGPTKVIDDTFSSIAKSQILGLHFRFPSKLEIPPLLAHRRS